MISINARNARRRCDKYERKFLEKGKKKKKKKDTIAIFSQFYWDANWRDNNVCNNNRRKEDWRDTSGVTRTFDPKPKRDCRVDDAYVYARMCVCVRAGRHDVKLTLTICRSGCCKKKEDTTKKIDNNQFGVSSNT